MIDCGIIIAPDDLTDEDRDALDTQAALEAWSESCPHPR